MHDHGKGHDYRENVKTASSDPQHEKTHQNLTETASGKSPRFLDNYLPGLIIEKARKTQPFLIKPSFRIASSRFQSPISESYLIISLGIASEA